MIFAPLSATIIHNLYLGRPDLFLLILTGRKTLKVSKGERARGRTSLYQQPHKYLHCSLTVHISSSCTLKVSRQSFGISSDPSCCYLDSTTFSTLSSTLPNSDAYMLWAMDLEHICVEFSLSRRWSGKNVSRSRT